MNDVIQAIRNKNTENIFLVFCNGILSKEYSDLQSFPKELIFDQVSEKKWVLRLLKNSKLESPLHIVYLQAHPIATHLENCIMTEKNSELTLIEEYVAHQATNYSIHSSKEMIAQRNSRIHYYKIQNEDMSAIHTSNIQITQSNDSEVNCFSFSMGGQQSRENLNVEQNEPGSQCQLYGLYQLREDKQQMDHYLSVNHLAEHGQSSMLYKGILDKKSRAEFKGKVHVHPEAKKISAFQANHHILLSNEAEANSKPELEIYADDIKCAHGATVGQLDPEALFYLRARGLDDRAAKQFLLDAFAEEVIGAIKNKDILQYIRGLIKQ